MKEFVLGRSILSTSSKQTVQKKTNSWLGTSLYWRVATVTKIIDQSISQEEAQFTFSWSNLKNATLSLVRER